MGDNNWLKYEPWYDERRTGDEVDGQKQGQVERVLNLGTVTDIELARAIMNACRRYALESGMDHIADYTLKLQEQFRPWIEAVLKETPVPVQTMPGNVGQATEGCNCPNCQAMRAQTIKFPGSGGEGGHA